MISAYIHEPSPLLQPQLERAELARRRERARPTARARGRGRRGARCRRCSGPRATRRPCSRTPARLVGLVYCSSPSASMTEITSEMFATQRRAAAPPTRARVVSASTRSVMSRQLVTMPRTAGSSRWFVATISIQRSSPSCARNRYADRLRRARARAQPLEHRGDRRAVLLEQPDVDRHVGSVVGIEAEEPARARAAVRARVPSAPTIVTMSLEFCTSERKRTSLSRSASSARF